LRGFLPWELAGLAAAFYFGLTYRANGHDRTGFFVPTLGRVFGCL